MMGIRRLVPATIMALKMAIIMASHASVARSQEAQPEEAQIADPPSQEMLDELRQQLAAERALNERLRRRVQDLEQQLATGDSSTASRAAAMIGEAEAMRMPLGEGTLTAIDEALVSRSLSLLPPGSIRLSPNFYWEQDGGRAERLESYISALDLQAGLPGRFALTLRIPYIQRDDALFGSNEGIGDVTVGLRRELAGRSSGRPSLIARLDYTHDSGVDAFDPVPISSGFRSLEAGLAIVARSDPIVISGGFAYNHAFGQDGVSIERDGTEIFRGSIRRGDFASLYAGVSLAATPRVSLDANVSFVSQQGGRFRSDDGPAVSGAGRTRVGYLDLGAGFVLSRRSYLSLSVVTGLTGDSIDNAFYISLPIRFQ